MDYKKRHTKKVKIPKEKKQPKPKKINKPTQENQQNNILKLDMKQQSSKANKDIERRPVNLNEKPAFEKIKGGRGFKLPKSFKVIIVCLILILSVVTFHLLTPTGIYDYLQNSFTSMGGTGEMPISITGNKSLGVFSDNNIIYSLTDTTLYSYNSSGKLLNSVQHGYMSPCLVTTNQRTLIYDRGNTGIRVDSLYTNYINKNFEEKIYTADLSQSGHLAVVSTKSNYTCQLQIFKNNYNDLLVSYSSADKHISSVKLSDNGKYAVFSTLSVENGTYCSTIKILNTSSKEIINEFEIENMMITKLEATSSCIFAQGSNKMITFNWNGQHLKEYNYSDISYFIYNDNGTVSAAYHPSGDARTTVVALFGKNGKQLFEIQTSGSLSGVCSAKNCIYTLIDNKIYKYNNKSVVEKEFTIGYQYNFISQYKNGVICASDMKINYFK